MGAGNKVDPLQWEFLAPVAKNQGGLGLYDYGLVDLGPNGQVLVSTPLADVPETCMIFLSVQNTNSGDVGFLYIESRTPGVNFEIRSSSNTDNSTVAWMLIVPETP